MTNFSKLGVSQNFIWDKYLQVYKISRIYDQFLIMQNILTNFSKLGVRKFFFLHTNTSRSTNLLKLMTNFQLCKIFWQFSLSLESSKIIFRTSTSSFTKEVELMTSTRSRKIFWQNYLSLESGKILFHTSTSRLKKLVELMTNF